MFRSGIHGLKNLVSSGRLTSMTILLAALSIPSAIAIRFLSLNQALFVSLGLVFVNIQSHLSRRIILSIAFALALLFIPFPNRYLFGVDLVPIVSLALIMFNLKRRAVFLENSKPAIRNFSNFYLIAAFSFAAVACLSSVTNYRSAEFVSWVLFPIASAIIVKLLQSGTTPTFKELMEFWIAGAWILMLVDTLGLLTSRYRSTDFFNFGRFTGSLGDYELSAEIYGVTVLAAIYVLLVTEGKAMRALALVEVICFVALLVATQTRSSFILTVFGIVMILFSSAVSKRVKRSLGTLALVGVSMYMVAASSGSFQDIWSRLTATELSQDIAGVANRAGVWGYFQNLRSYTDISPIGNGFSYPYDEIQTYPHSLYLWVFWSGGILTLAILVSLAIGSIGSAVSRFKEFREDASASLVILGFLFIDQAKVEVARFASTSWVFWLVVALTFSRFERRDKVALARNGK